VFRRQQAGASPVALPVPLHIGSGLQELPLRPSKGTPSEPATFFTLIFIRHSFFPASLTCPDHLFFFPISPAQKTRLSHQNVYFCL
jgi:hypothetical protein